jgi:hypothetical protein
LGVLKLTGNPRVAEEMSKREVGRYLRLLGVMEIAFAALFVVPATMKLGFILASCYFAGAIATELSHHALKVNPFVPIVLLWIGAPPDAAVSRFLPHRQSSGESRFTTLLNDRSRKPGQLSQRGRKDVVRHSGQGVK